eukprot:1285507-Rhodomonas_salina.4
MNHFLKSTASCSAVCCCIELSASHQSARRCCKVRPLEQRFSSRSALAMSSVQTYRSSWRASIPSRCLRRNKRLCANTSEASSRTSYLALWNASTARLFCRRTLASSSRNAPRSVGSSPSCCFRFSTGCGAEPSTFLPRPAQTRAAKAFCGPCAGSVSANQPLLRKAARNPGRLARSQAVSAAWLGAAPGVDAWHGSSTLVEAWRGSTRAVSCAGRDCRDMKEAVRSNLKDTGRRLHKNAEQTSRRSVWESANPHLRRSVPSSELACCEFGAASFVECVQIVPAGRGTLGRWVPRSLGASRLNLGRRRTTKIFGRVAVFFCTSEDSVALSDPLF